MAFKPSTLKLFRLQQSPLRPFTTPRYTPILTRTLTTSPPSPPLKTALITGASGGIGSAIARRLSKEGHTCILIGRNISKLQTVLRGLDTSRCASSPSVQQREHRIEVGDVGSEEFWSTLAKTMKSQNTTPTILINSAGLAQSSLLLRTPPSTIQQLLSTNLTGTILGCQTVMKGMLATRAGVIVNVGSLLAVRGGRGAVVYAAGKAGVIGLTRALVAETVGTGIRVNCILPGYIDTAMTYEGFAPAEIAKLTASIPAQRFGTAEEVADAVWFLVSNEYANNCVLNLDGGLSAV